MPHPHVFHTATLLPNGTELVVGGSIAADNTSSSSVDLYDPAANSWLELPAMNKPRALHTATLLNDGTVLVAGGYIWEDPNGTGYGRYPWDLTNSSEVWTPTTNGWTLTSSAMEMPRYHHAAVKLADGSVMVAG